jgi:hypothetical protein
MTATAATTITTATTTIEVNNKPDENANELR